jgi:uncharacterized protein (TIGR03083 family)
MTRSATDIDVRIRAERERLLHVLEALDDAGWRTPSLCAGWSVRELVVHVRMPYELSTPRFLLLMLRSGFSFDRAADAWATSDTRTPAQLLDALRATEHGRFAIPGAPAEAPLSHLVIHAQDVYRPLGVPSPTDPETAGIVLDQLLSPRARKSLTPGLLDGLAFSATDTRWRHGEGPLVSGPASALLTTLAGRDAALEELSGDGVATVSGRFGARAAR